jgi:hypothetical protein
MAKFNITVRDDFFAKNLTGTFEADTLQQAESDAKDFYAQELDCYRDDIVIVSSEETQSLVYSQHMSLEQLTEYAKGITKRELAIQLDAYSPVHNFSAERGLTSYKRYSREQLLEICHKLRINPRKKETA